jgi:hypothetical protein
MVVLTELHQTCGACPSQWKGTAEDGRRFYARYRWGWLTWGFGRTDGDAIDASIESPGVKLGDDLDGVLSTLAMLDEIGLEVRCG